MPKEPQEWRGAFASPSPDEQKIVVLTTSGETYVAQTPEELWAHIIDAARATRLPSLRDIGNLAPGGLRREREKAKARRTQREVAAKLIAKPRKPAAEELTLDDLLGPQALTLEDLFGKDPNAQET